MSLALLQASLELAVPLWIERYRGRSFDERQWLAQRALPVILEHGDDILYRSKKRGVSASAFNALAEAIAIGTDTLLDLTTVPALAIVASETRQSRDDYRSLPKLSDAGTSDCLP